MEDAFIPWEKADVVIMRTKYNILKRTLARVLLKKRLPKAEFAVIDKSLFGKLCVFEHSLSGDMIEKKWDELKESGYTVNTLIKRDAVGKIIRCLAVDEYATDWQS